MGKMYVFYIGREVELRNSSEKRLETILDTQGHAFLTYLDISRCVCFSNLVGVS